MRNTTAPSGGFTYNPTTSTGVSSKRLSFDTLKVRTRCGLRPRADHTRCTVAALTPTALAMLRQLQCVSPGGFSSKVSRTISATFSAGIDAFRPRPSRTCANFARPSCSKRSRHARTVTADTPTSDAIRLFATPSAASSNARARPTSRCGEVVDFTKPSKRLSG